MEEQHFRVKTPRKGEVLGIVESMLGANKMRVYCDDNKFRICRIPGRLRKRVWIREGNAVLIRLWEIQGDKNGDVIWRYTPTEASWLRKKGILKINL